jgi:PTS system arbutin-like IIC component
MFVYIFNVRVCATNGILDFLVINLPAGVGKTHWPMYVLIGLVEIVVIFFVFKFMIEKMNLKTPGREDDSEDIIDLNENAAAVKNQMKSAVVQDEPKADREKALTIIKALGGKENILTVENCFSRLRVEVVDNSVIDEKTLKTTGASGVVRKGNNIQVVYGLTINKIRTIVDEALEIKE